METVGATRRYYSLVFFLLVLLAAYLATKGDTQLAISALVAAPMGMIGEAAFSAWWRGFFTKPFWEYQVQPTLKGYTSALNLIPWAVGGVMYVGITKLVGYVPSLENLTVFWIAWAVTFGVTLFVRLGRKHTFTKVTFGNYLLFSAPIYIPIAVAAGMNPDQPVIAAAVLFGLIACLAEYVFGKVCERFTSKRLWLYNHKASDHGHFTPLSILPFALAGFYFLTLYATIGYLI